MGESSLARVRDPLPLVVRGQYGGLTRVVIETPDFMLRPSTPIERAFVQFHKANPQVYAELELLARQWWEKRKPKRMGIKTLYETCRYKRHLATGGDRFKLNNNFTALYARLLVAHHPEWEKVIELRERVEKLTPSGAIKPDDFSCTCGTAYGKPVLEEHKCLYCKVGANV